MILRVQRESYRDIKSIHIMPMIGLELATSRLQTECSSHWAIQLKSYCWEGVEFIQLVYCIIIFFLSFLNCDWLLIREVQWFYWTQELLVPVEKFSLKMLMMGLELATPRLQTECSRHWAIQLKSYLGRSWVYPVGVLHHYIFLKHFSTVIDFSSENYSGSTGHRNSWYQWRNFSEDADDGTRSNSQPLDYKPSALAIELYSSKAIAGKELSLSSWCIVSLYFLLFLNCDWLLIRKVQWFYWTQELLVPVEKFSVRMPMMELDLQYSGKFQIQKRPALFWNLQCFVNCSMERSIR